MDGIGDRDKSEFNAGIKYLYDIMEKWEGCRVACEMQDSYLWWNQLLSLKMFLNGWMSKDQQSRFDKPIPLIWAAVNSQVMDQNRGKVKGMDPRLFQVLYKYEQDLATVIKESGLLMKLKDSAWDALK